MKLYARVGPPEHLRPVEQVRAGVTTPVLVDPVLVDPVEVDPVAAETEEAMLAIITAAMMRYFFI